jgi:hypothetical protein
MALGPTATFPGDSLDQTLYQNFTDSSQGDWRINAGQTDPNIADTGDVPDTLVLGPYQGPAVLRWTAPTTGVINITSSGANDQNCCDGGQRATNFLVYDNNTQKFSDYLPNLGSSANYDAVLNVTAGDTIDFIAYNNGGGDNNSLTLFADINYLPEPSSIIALCGLAAAGMLLALRRRRSK